MLNGLPAMKKSKQEQRDGGHNSTEDDYWWREEQERDPGHPSASIIYEFNLKENSFR